LIDFQFLLQEIMHEKGITLSQLAEKAGVSKGRISQVMGPVANPTAKTFARLFYALGEDVVLSVKSKNRKSAMDEPKLNESEFKWEWTTTSPDLAATIDDAQFVAVLKEAAAKDSSGSNDNRKRAVRMEENEVITMLLEAA
jgi:transcriptional regulator with XRE-family HTH domain